MQDRIAFRRSSLVAGGLFLVYAALATYPFRWSPPRRIDNGAAPMPAGGWSFPRPGLVRTREAPAWLEQVRDAGRLEVEFTVRSFDVDQRGPARILTLSRDPKWRNLTIAQKSSDLVLRLRTPDTNRNGMPSHRVPGVFADGETKRVRVLVEPGSLEIHVDDRQVLAGRLPPEPLAGWDTRTRLGLGNELTGRRPWRGEIARARMLAGGVWHDYTTPRSLERPDCYWAVNHAPLYIPFQRVETLSRSLLEWALNLLGFVPLGLLLAWTSSRPSLIRIALLSASFSALIEASQILFDDRYPSVTDWILNTTGGLLGGLLFLAWRRRDL